MDLKPIVKVMNFHALLRVESSKRQANLYQEMEKELLKMIDLIVNNRNFILDKKIMNPSEKHRELNIYFGSDLGFCAFINTAISSQLAKDKKDNYKIVIGKKVAFSKNSDLYLSREVIDKDVEEYKRITDIIKEGIVNRKFAKINLIYNHYYNSSDIRLVNRCIYPLAKGLISDRRYSGDFAVEGDMEEIFINILVTYLNYELKIAFKNTYASENILRESSTSQSLKKIDEKEEEDRNAARKQKNAKASQKILDNYLKSKTMGGA